MCFFFLDGIYMAYVKEIVARMLIDIAGLDENEAGKVMIKSGVIDKEGNLTKEAFEKGWGIIEKNKEKITQEGQKHIGITLRKTGAKLV